MGFASPRQVCEDNSRDCSKNIENTAGHNYNFP